MPTFDGGHYFLTALIPIDVREIRDGSAFTSPVHALRKRLDMWPTAAETIACGGGQSPFARNTRNHFVRLVVIDDVAYNGRNVRNAIATAITGDNPTVAQTQDHLSCPFLLFAADFDAENGDDSSRDSYLNLLWTTMKDELCGILTFCRRFDERVTDAESFAKYVADCQIETTMSFNDYYLDLKLPPWPAAFFKWAAIISASALVLGLLALLVRTFATSLEAELEWAAALAGLGAAALVLVAVGAYGSVMAAGRKPFPAASYAKLPVVLKSLYLQRTFTRFVIDNQMSAADPQAARALHDAFAAFVKDNHPDDADNPTQAPGVIGF